MKVSEVLAHLDKLPKPIEFDWTGVEQWHPEVFDERVKTLEEAISYIKQLRERLGQLTFAMHDLAKSQNEIINWIRQIEILK